MSTIEKQIALRNAAEIAESNAYFSARPTTDTNDRRNVFEAGFNRGWQSAHVIIAELEAQLAAVQKDAAWIPVSERLPKEGESVFVFSKYGQSDMADFIGGAFENCWLIDDADETLTHWVGKPPYPPIDKTTAGEAT